MTKKTEAKAPKTAPVAEAQPVQAGPTPLVINMEMPEIVEAIADKFRNNFMPTFYMNVGGVQFACYPAGVVQTATAPVAEAVEA
jgi:hypothetical protein